MLPASHLPDQAMFRSAAPVFPVADVNAAVRWYGDVLGFEALHVNADADGTANYAIVRLGEVQLHLLQNGFDDEPTRSPAEAMFTMSGDIDALEARLKQRGLVFHREIADQPWGARDFTVLDPDGNSIWIASFG
ncbi:MAG: VOC family protein [Gammaproteobacteria bacterium]|nr:VOC family protein [Gammaproteobacteria bacterium]